jgi:predicted transcriptional regulator
MCYMTPESMDAIFQALAHAARRRMLDLINASPGCSVNDVAAHFEFSRIAVMKHLRVLEAAGLVHSEKAGRTRRLYFNAAPIQMICDRWTTQYSRYWASRMTRIKYAVEGAEEGPATPPAATDPQQREKEPPDGQDSGG